MELNKAEIITTNKKFFSGNTQDMAKLPTTGIAINSIFINTDNNEIWSFDGSKWKSSGGGVVSLTTQNSFAATISNATSDGQTVATSTMSYGSGIADLTIDEANYEYRVPISMDMQSLFENWNPVFLEEPFIGIGQSIDTRIDDGIKTGLYVSVPIFYWNDNEGDERLLLPNAKNSGMYTFSFTEIDTYVEIIMGVGTSSGPGFTVDNIRIGSNPEEAEDVPEEEWAGILQNSKMIFFSQAIDEGEK